MNIDKDTPPRAARRAPRLRVLLFALLQFSLPGEAAPAARSRWPRRPRQRRQPRKPGRPPAASGRDEVWITLGADAFATASRLFVAGADGLALARVAEVEGVVLTRVPRAELPALSARIHDELRRCGGFFAHESRAEAAGRAGAARRPAARRGARGRCRS